MKSKLLLGNKVRILLHIVAWIILLGLPVYIVSRWDIGRDFVWFYYINVIINGMVFYGNYLVLVPRLFFSSPRVKYYLAALALIVGLYITSDFLNDIAFKYVVNERVTDASQPPPEGRRDRQGPSEGERRRRPPFGLMHITNFGFTNLFITFFALGLRVLDRNAQIEERQKELEKEKLNSELAFLKNQISPHFFFNTLNNIYSLISINTEDSQKAVLQLSRMMRYLLYESEHGETELSKEIDFMNNYIDLMRLRMNEKVKLTVSFPSKYNNISIPPLLFIQIIENAFKHGLSYREKSFIDIDMEVTEELITFRCSNSKVKSSDEPSPSHSGIGLENVSKRLNLLYPGKHEFKIDRSETAFNVLINIHYNKS